MDAVLFRGSQKLEHLQLQADMVASKAKDLLHTYSQTTRALLAQVWHSEKLGHLKHNIIHLVTYILEVSKDFKERAIDVADPKRLWMFLAGVIGGRWSKREISIACASFMVGGIVGVAVTLAIKKREKTVRYMEAVQIKHYSGAESVSVVEDAIAPYECGDGDVLINVKAASVQIVDAHICSGYGRTLRRILRKLYKQSNSDLPLILGRDCTGVITDLGKDVNRLEIGDEVWVTVPFWSQGCLSQTVLVSNDRVARKPKNVGFEGACSIPYAGSLALSALSEADVDVDNATGKRFLIQDGCTPSGCVLVQLLSHWKAHVTTTCFKRAVPVAKALGADEVISLEDPQSPGSQTLDPCKTLIKELQARGEVYDFIVLTRNSAGGTRPQWMDLNEFLSDGGKILTTVPEELLSDGCGFLGRSLLASYVRLKYWFERLLGLPLADYAEAHLCHATLERLTELVEDGVLQTVVDKVFQPRDVELALHYIQSAQSIGSSVVTFR